MVGSQVVRLAGVGLEGIKFKTWNVPWNWFTKLHKTVYNRSQSSVVCSQQAVFYPYPPQLLDSVVEPVVFYPYPTQLQTAATAASRQCWQRWQNIKNNTSSDKPYLFEAWLFMRLILELSCLPATLLFSIWDQIKKHFDLTLLCSSVCVSHHPATH